MITMKHSSGQFTWYLQEGWVYSVQQLRASHHQNLLRACWHAEAALASHKDIVCNAYEDRHCISTSRLAHEK